MITTIYLKEFVLTGEFGPVKIGMNINEVQNFLGDTDIINDYGTGTIGINYGYYEFFFDKNSNLLKSIQNDNLLADNIEHKMMINFCNNKIIINTWFLKSNENITRKEIKKTLNNQKIIFTEEVFWEHNIIKFSSGVSFDFDEPEDCSVSQENQVLKGIRFFPNK